MCRLFRPLRTLKFFHTYLHPGESLPLLPSLQPRAEVPMLEKMTSRLDFQANALVLRSQRQQVIASNIANADTPGYVARDFDFAKALQAASGSTARAAVNVTSAQHMRLGAAGSGNPEMAYTVQTQPSQDGNLVDLDRERANFVDNSIRYESTLRFINGHVKTMLSAITGQ
jgi:flagellar basal-body rod protein FlgB